MKTRSSGLAAGVLTISALFASPALAAPVTVDLRIEGPTRTLFEGPVTTDVRTFRFTGEATEHRCDGTSENQGNSPTPQPTRGAAVTEASERTPFTIRGTFGQSFRSPTFSEINGENVAFNERTNEFLGEYKNGQFSEFGSCGDPIAGGDRVLFAYGQGDEALLGLTGPPTARPGEAFELTVADEKGAPVSGASVGGQTTGPDGKARVVAAQRGPNDYKATKPDAIRSNRVTVCATDGQDGFCGTTRPGEPAQPGQPAAPARTPDRGAPVTRIAGIRDGQTFGRGSAPRELQLSATDSSGIASLKVRLTRRHRGKCAYFSGRRAEFRRAKCGRRFFFKAGDQASVNYLLPEALSPGRYVLDVIAVDRAGNRDGLERGRNRVVFTVR